MCPSTKKLASCVDFVTGLPSNQTKRFPLLNQIIVQFSMLSIKGKEAIR